jgi:hypothetical protein
MLRIFSVTHGHTMAKNIKSMAKNMKRPNRVPTVGAT